LRETPRPSEQQVRDLLTGHLCRCTGYTPIVCAAMEAAAEMDGDVAKEKSDA
jgi:2-furoyl-CoA dehydrogenase 2Fe-2S iron sulfur subunit